MQASNQRIDELTAELEAVARGHADAEAGRASAEAAAEAARSRAAAEQLASLEQMQKQTEERCKVCASVHLLFQMGPYLIVFAEVEIILLRCRLLDLTGGTTSMHCLAFSMVGWYLEQ